MKTVALIIGALLVGGWALGLVYDPKSSAGDWRTPIVTVSSDDIPSTIPAGGEPADPGFGWWVSEYGMDAKMRSTYDSATCFGLRNAGTHSLDTAAYGWVPGYFRFECTYSTGGTTCYGGRFESDKNGGAWFPRMLSPGRCYS